MVERESACHLQAELPGSYGKPSGQVFDSPFWIVARWSDRRKTGSGVHSRPDSDRVRSAEGEATTPQPEDDPQHCRSSEASSWRQGVARLETVVSGIPIQGATVLHSRGDAPDHRRGQRTVGSVVRNLGDDGSKSG